jgi:tetratricopeptide (TPR) repeat protein
MLAKGLIVYYSLVLLYGLALFLNRRKGAALQVMILIGCPFLGAIVILAMFKKPKQSEEMPEWLHREEYEDVSLQAPNRDIEMNTIPFLDALMLNDSTTKRKTLISFLKKEFLNQSDALALALKSDDTETSHYAATALQQTKSQLTKELKLLERMLLEDSTDIEIHKQYVDVLKQSVQMEFLDQRTRQKYMYLYSDALSRLLALNPSNSSIYYNEKIAVALELTEFQEALETAEAFIKQFPHSEDAYFAAMDVHFHMRNNKAFFQLVDKIRMSSIRLSPGRLNQLRYWLQGGLYE